MVQINRSDDFIHPKFYFGGCRDRDGSILFSSQDGMINMLLNTFGFPSIDFLGSPKWFPHIYVWSGVWQGVGWGTLIYTAAMSGISPDQYEAAYLDGASRLQCIRHITIPSIMPTIVISTILATGSILSVGFVEDFSLTERCESRFL